MFDIQEPASRPLDRGDSVLQIRLGVADLSAEDRSSWTGSAKSERLVELLEIRERLDAEVLRLADSWDRDRAWEIDGSLSPRAWLSYRTPLSDGDAQRLVRNARLVGDHDEISQALACGEITTPHVEAIGRVTSKDREPLLADHTPVLVEQARKLPVGEFSTVMRHWASLADDELGKETFTKKWDRRHLHAAVGFDGWVTGDFYLDPVAGALLITVLDHEAPPDPEDAPDGPRTLSQRRADALADIIGRHMGGGKPGANPPNVNAVIDVATLAGESPDLATARCEVDGIGVVARTVLDQMCCDARFTRFVMSGPSQILDMGRSTRLATSSQSRAVRVRDRHCRFPSCDRRPQWCDIHHIAGWVESLGATNIDNLILLCRRHHTLMHNSEWAITKNGGGEFEFTHPARGP
ncbi:MAG: DUF222 domain-containing protein [bacterium]|nr:DUF222 domain-containing protein [bacterium]